MYPDISTLVQNSTGCRRFAAAAFLLHLTLPLLYALFVPTLFSGWYYSHYALANGIWYALIVLGLISCIVSLVRKVRRMI